MRKNQLNWIVLATVNLCVLGMLFFHQESSAWQTGQQQPFANAVDQRQEMIRELKAIRGLLEEQNTLLRGNHQTKVEKKK